MTTPPNNTSTTRSVAVFKAFKKTASCLSFACFLIQMGVVATAGMAIWMLSDRYYSDLFTMNSDGCLGNPGERYDCTINWKTWDSEFLKHAISFCDSYMVNARAGDCFKDCMRLRNCYQITIPKSFFVGALDVLIGGVGLVILSLCYESLKQAAHTFKAEYKKVRAGSVQETVPFLGGQQDRLVRINTGRNFKNAL